MLADIYLNKSILLGLVGEHSPSIIFFFHDEFSLLVLDLGNRFYGLINVLLILLLKIYCHYGLKVLIWLVYLLSFYLTAAFALGVGLDRSKFYLILLLMLF